MKKIWFSFAFLLGVFSTQLLGQSLLDGTSFQVSTYNLPDSVGVVRLVDGAESNCRSEARSPIGDDLAPEGECLVVDSGGEPVTMTFNAGAQVIGGLRVTPTAVPFAGLPEDSTVITNNPANDITDAPLLTWTSSGDLVEFTLRTTDNTNPWTDNLDFFGFAATGIAYPNADPAAEIGMPYDEDFGGTGNYVNSYFWFETEDGPVTEYDILIDTGIGAGRHPVDADRQVIYTFLSSGQMDEASDTVAGGTLDYFSHGSILDQSPDVGNLDNLAFFSGIEDVDSVTGWGLGVLIQPPSGDAVPTCESIAASRIPGDADGNGEVAFSDFLALANGFGTDAGYEGGDFDCNGEVAFLDFLTLANNFGTTEAAGVSAVPEPSTIVLLGLTGLFGGLLCRRR